MYNTQEKRTDYMRKWREKNPEKVKIAQEKESEEYRKILYILKINGCAICGYNKCNSSLEFHHVNPKDKKFNITLARMGSRTLIDELNKCILLCANCHGEKNASKMC